MQTLPSSQFQYIQEWDDEFLALFPHRFDYIWAPHPTSGEDVEWKTESRHPLSDRLIRQGAFLYGVRFGAETNYCLLDIDQGSPYHPKHDPFAISRIVAALEPIGLVSYIACSSSYSGGLHLYFPFQQTQTSWNLAIGLVALLESHGFKVNPGHLEVFPNPKPYMVNGTMSLFNAHRLPLQHGSYLLNEDFQPIWSDQRTFLAKWKFAQSRNDINARTLKQVIKQARRKRYCISGKADKFINDLNTEIEQGWTGPGQTNRLLGRITMRAYIFHHILASSDPLEGQALVDEIVETAQSLPGYHQWCRHQHEIEQRAQEWARCIENSHYFHYGDAAGKFKSKLDNPDLSEAIEQVPTWNQQQSESTRERIRHALADLLDKGTLPARATARFHALTQYRIGGGSLYRHRDLWHPSYLSQAPVENPPHPPASIENEQLDCVGDASNWHSPPSLLPTNAGNDLLGRAFSDFNAQSPESSGGNHQPDEARESTHNPAFNIQRWLEVSQEARKVAKEEQQRIRLEAAQSAHIDRMQQYLDSDDPILVAEALAWAAINPCVLNLNTPGAHTDPNASQISNFSDTLAAISVCVQRLGWPKEQVIELLQQHFNKPSQDLLDDDELVQWLKWLEAILQQAF